VSAQTFDAVLELALLGLCLGVCGYAVRLIYTTVRPRETPAPHEEAPGPD
jgi:hypothetical protein